MKIIWGIGILAAGQSSTMTVSKMLLNFQNISLVLCFCTVHGILYLVILNNEHIYF